MKENWKHMGKSQLLVQLKKNEEFVEIWLIRWKLLNFHEKFLCCESMQNFITNYLITGK